MGFEGYVFWIEGMGSVKTNNSDESIELQSNFLSIKYICS